MSDYEDKIKNQINQYKNLTNIHDLPQIYHYWSCKHLRSLMNEVFEVDTIPDLYAKYMFGAFDEHSNNKILSAGSGYCSEEIRIAKELLCYGAKDFTFYCHELSPFLLERARKQIGKERLVDYFVLIESDLNNWVPQNKYCSAMAHHSLHHIVNLEGLFQGIYDSLTENGVFITCDMIGRNGHMRWPEALELVQAFWRILPKEYKFNHQLRRIEEVFKNHDCSTEGFEGIRAQDILGLLVEQFHFAKFLGFGNLTDVFVDRCYGHNFSQDNEKDCAFIDLLHLVNTILIDVGYLKPTMMMAVMDKGEGPTKSYRHWTPEFCIRKTNKNHIPIKLMQNFS